MELADVALIVSSLAQRIRCTLPVPLRVCGVKSSILRSQAGHSEWYAVPMLAPAAWQWDLRAPPCPGFHCRAARPSSCRR